MCARSLRKIPRDPKHARKDVTDPEVTVKTHINLARVVSDLEVMGAAPYPKGTLVPNPGITVLSDWVTLVDVTGLELVGV